MYNINITILRGYKMISFLILIIVFLIPVCHNFIIDIKENKMPLRAIICIILLVIAIYLKSINM